MSQKHSVEPKGHERAHTSVVLVNVLPFADFCDLTVITTRRKSLPFVASVD